MELERKYLLLAIFIIIILISLAIKSMGVF